MIEDDKIKHEGTNEVRYISGGISYASNKIGGDGKIKLFAVLSERLVLEVIEFVVLFYFIFDIFIVFEKGNQFISLSISTDCQHNRVF